MPQNMINIAYKISNTVYILDKRSFRGDRYEKTVCKMDATIVKHWSKTHFNADFSGMFELFEKESGRFYP